MYDAPSVSLQIFNVGLLVNITARVDFNGRDRQLLVSSPKDAGKAG